MDSLLSSTIRVNSLVFWDICQLAHLDFWASPERGRVGNRVWKRGWVLCEELLTRSTSSQHKAAGRRAGTRHCHSTGCLCGHRGLDCKWIHGPFSKMDFKTVRKSQGRDWAGEEKPQPAPVPFPSVWPRLPASCRGVCALGESRHCT